MRKFILIAAMVLASATAQAGPMRSLTLASNEPPAAAETTKAAQTPATTEAPVYVARPAPVGTTSEASKAETTRPVAEKASRTSSAAKPKRKREPTEARVIRELNRTASIGETPIASLRSACALSARAAVSRRANPRPSLTRDPVTSSKLIVTCEAVHIRILQPR